MLKLIIFAVLIFSTMGLWFTIVQLNNSANNPSVIGVHGTSTVRVTHSYDSGIHRYTGEIRLPHSCFDLRLNENGADPFDPSRFVIILESSDRMLEQRLCAKIMTRYPFQLVVDGPPDMQVTLTLNGVSMPIQIKETAWQAGRNIISNPNDSLKQ